MVALPLRYSDMQRSPQARFPKLSPLAVTICRLAPQQPPHIMTGSTDTGHPGGTGTATSPQLEGAVRQHTGERIPAPLWTAASYLLLLQLGDLLLHHGDLAVHAVHVLNELLLR